MASSVGAHELRPGFALAITVAGDRLMSQATGQSKVPRFAAADGQPSLEVVDVRFGVIKNASGAVMALVLHQGGRDLRGARKP